MAIPLPANGPREFYQPAKLSGLTASPMNMERERRPLHVAEADALWSARPIRPLWRPGRAYNCWRFLDEMDHAPHATDLCRAGVGGSLTCTRVM